LLPSSWGDHAKLLPEDLGALACGRIRLEDGGRWATLQGCETIDGVGTVNEVIRELWSEKREPALSPTCADHLIHARANRIVSDNDPIGRTGD
jgi:hypothetical protein